MKITHIRGDPTGTGPIPASKLCLEKAGWSIEELDIIEANEAFAAQAISVNQSIGWDVKKVNVNGGAIAIGHPIGASGCRILVTLLYEMKRSDAKKGLATLCIGGGQGVLLWLLRDKLKRILTRLNHHKLMRLRLIRDTSKQYQATVIGA